MKSAIHYSPKVLAFIGKPIKKAPTMELALNNSTPTQLDLLLMVRMSGLSLPAITALAIVDSNSHAKCPMVYIGEVEAFFIERCRGTENTWSYSAISRMLNILTAKGFLSKEKHGKFNAYGMTTKGIKLIAKIGINNNG